MGFRDRAIDKSREVGDLTALLTQGGVRAMGASDLCVSGQRLAMQRDRGLEAERLDFRLRLGDQRFVALAYRVRRP